MPSPTRRILLASLAIAGASLAGAAQARSDVYWSIGINAPIDRGVSVGTVISNGPVYAPVYGPVYSPPVVVMPQPVYAPPPVVYAPPPRVVYRPVRVMPAPVVYAPVPVYVQRPHRQPRQDWRRWNHDPRERGGYRDHRGHGRDWDRDEMPYRGEPILYSPR